MDSDDAADLLGELTARGREWLLPRVALPLRDRPRAVVAPDPNRPARVHDQHLHDRAGPAEQQDPGTANVTVRRTHLGRNSALSVRKLSGLRCSITSANHE